MPKRLLAILLLVIVAAGGACERSERHMARELLRLKHVHEALLEEAALLYIALHREGRVAEAEEFLTTIRTLDEKLRTVERDAAAALMIVLSFNRKEDRKVLAERAALLLEMVAELAAVVQHRRERR